MHVCLHSERKKESKHTSTWSIAGLLHSFFAEQHTNPNYDVTKALFLHCHPQKNWYLSQLWDFLHFFCLFLFSPLYFRTLSFPEKSFPSIVVTVQIQNIWNTFSGTHSFTHTFIPLRMVLPKRNAPHKLSFFLWD